MVMAQKFIELGHTVLGCGRSRDVIDQLRARYRCPPHDFAAVDVSQEYQVEPWAARLLSSHGAPDLLINNAGIIINISSGWGRSVSSDVAPYCASKWAIEGLTQALAEELPRGMAAIPLDPGVIDTDMLRSCFGGRASRFPAPKDWAEKA